MGNVEIDSYRIEVLAKGGDSSTERGALLEMLAKRVLSAMQCSHISTNIRVTGMELDVFGEDNQSGEKILVECKAYRDRTISSEVILKLFGQVSFSGFSSGWLLCTSELGKDAQGLREEFRKRPEGERKKLGFYDPQELISLLISLGQVSDPLLLEFPSEVQFSRTATLLITDIGEFWAVPAIGSSSGVADTVFVFHAKIKNQITDKALVAQLSSRDSNLKELTWIASDQDASATTVLSDAALKRELDSIAPVPIADSWSDYRPARPQDFVGRDETQKEILVFLDDIRQQKSLTRLLAIKAPSGWGKSSFLNKLQATCANTRNKSKYYLYPVDCRTASSARYPELALKRCLDAAVSDGFLPHQFEKVTVGSAGDPLSSPSMRPLLDYLRDEHKVVVLFFDQFEEITSREEFSDLFRAVKAICSAIDSARENIVLGFSWKTDGAIPTDHPAYYTWHQFADRRKEFEISLFSAAEISQLLGGLARELKHSIDPFLRRLLSEQCQGYPWLLKKLCIHVFGVLKTSPTKQRELLERALDIDALFKRDLERLQSVETACIRRIAQESPADFHSIESTFGAQVIEKLTNQRLIVRNSGKLILYWDIFREYVLTGQAPRIPSRYIPVTGPASAKEMLEYLLGRNWVSLGVLSRKFNLKVGTLDNVARDLVMMGVAQYNRKEERIRLTKQDTKSVLDRLFVYASTHLVYRSLVDGETTSSSFSVGDVMDKLKISSGGESYTPHTWRSTALRLLLWMRVLGLVRWESEEKIFIVPNPISPRAIEQLAANKVNTRRSLFKAEASPLKVIEVLNALSGPDYLPAPEDRNSLYVLRSLGAIASTSVPALIERPSNDLPAWLTSRVLETSTFRAALDLYRREKDISAVDVGQVIEDISGRPLSSSSKTRYGSGLLLWIRWVIELVQGRLPQKL